MARFDDTIVALSTPPGVGAIGVIRVSGNDAFKIVNTLFGTKDLTRVDSHTLHYGALQQNDQILDEVVVSVFKGPNSYTKEDVIEISCHGSNFIIQQIIRALIQSGARLAKPGEFTQRAFLNGRFDLAQAEGVADLINAESEAAHMAALSQMRGGISREIQNLREELVHFASMIELELDFSEEDVEFASRDELKKLVDRILEVIEPLLESFQLGNAIKNGIPTVIAGKPNAGKSTLLNAILNDERAIVSDIPGTTRDVIEDEMVIEGVHFRFIDTAGIRETDDRVEKIGVEKTHTKMREASLVLYLIDLANDRIKEIEKQIEQLESKGVPFVLVGNKLDKARQELTDHLSGNEHFVTISALTRENLNDLRKKILKIIHLDDFKTGNTIITNSRHFESLTKTKAALLQVIEGLDNQVTNDFLALDIRNALNHLGEITGEITTDDLLDNIFSKFCIGK